MENKIAKGSLFFIIALAFILSFAAKVHAVELTQDQVESIQSVDPIDAELEEAIATQQGY